MNEEKNYSQMAAECLREKNIHPSYHRLKILEYLMQHKTHPTVEMMYKDLLTEIPTLSKTTIYNTLKAFAGNNLVLELTIEENEVRFDFDTSNHAHFKCTKCGAIYDIEKKFSLFESDVVDEHKITESHIYFKGVCKKCLDENK